MWLFSCGTVQAGYSPLSDWQVWQCGGSVEVLPCSRIAHIERAHKPYTENLTAHVRRNALRVAEVWMDQHKSHVYMAWNVPLQVRKRKARARGLCGWRAQVRVQSGIVVCAQGLHYRSPSNYE